MSENKNRPADAEEKAVGKNAGAEDPATDASSVSKVKAEHEDK